MSTPSTTPPTCSSSSSLSTEHSLLSEQELDELELVPDVRLAYDIEAYSSFMSTYAPRHILDDRPSDPGSRWSSATTNSPQFLLLVLPSLAIIRSITLGKFHKIHVCNLKEFKVYGSRSLGSDMIELLHADVRNDEEPEDFPLKYQLANGIAFACRYIKIVPLATWKHSTNFSIWHVQLHGVEQPSIVQRVAHRFEQYCDHEATRLCLKHLRQRGMLDAFHAIQQQSHTQLEHPLITELFHRLVLEGNFERAEELLHESYTQRLFESHLSQSEYRANWTCLIPPTSLADLYSGKSDRLPSDRPGMRGGHQMCIDTAERRIYLFGGWDGSVDLSDFWYYDLRLSQWILISSDTRSEQGPGPRSCHKMCFDAANKRLYTLGRYVDPENSTSDTTPLTLSSLIERSSDTSAALQLWSFLPSAVSIRQALAASAANDEDGASGAPGSRRSSGNAGDFYCYDIPSASWICLSSDTMADGGPALIYDHQMCIDSEAQVIYVFGGRTFLEHSQYSGLFAYDIRARKWTELRSDGASGDRSKGVAVRSRIGHSMLFHAPIDTKTNTRRPCLYIFAGQRNKDYLSDFYKYDITTDRFIEVSRDCSKQGGPGAGFTQRATLDPEREEICVFSGLMRDRDSTTETVKNSFWVYHIQRKMWRCVYQNEHTDAMYWEAMRTVEPRPRFAHQLVFDPAESRHYLFGGNPGDPDHTRFRLADFWSLHLQRPSSEDVVQRAKFLLRKQCFLECVASQRPMEALKYLQTQVSQVTNHADRAAVAEFHKLAAAIFLQQRQSGRVDSASDAATTAASTTTTTSAGSAQPASSQSLHQHRMQVFEALLEFYPSQLTQPTSNIVDFILKGSSGAQHFS